MTFKLINPIVEKSHWFRPINQTITNIVKEKSIRIWTPLRLKEKFKRHLFLRIFIAKLFVDQLRELIIPFKRKKLVYKLLIH